MRDSSIFSKRFAGVTSIHLTDGTLASRRLAGLRLAAHRAACAGVGVISNCLGFCQAGSETQPGQPARTPALRKDALRCTRHRNASPSAVALSVFSSRYFTMTGV